jgi:hypothetical protein
VREFANESERQVWIRTRIALGAYAYEIMGKTFISDAEFDRLCRQVDVNISTNRPDLDAWFKKEFDSSTGVWIYHHPDLGRIKHLLENTLKDKLS